MFSAVHRIAQVKVQPITGPKAPPPEKISR